MVCFKSYLVLEDFKNTYVSCVRDILIEKACLEAIKIIIESDSEQDDDEPFTGDLEAEKFPEPNQNTRPVGPEAKPDIDSSEEEIELKQSNTMRDLQKQLRDAILTLRWEAIRQRSQDIDKLKSIRDQYLRSNEKNVAESSEDDMVDGEEDFLQAMNKVSSKFDVMQAVPLLEKLGYIDIDKLKTKEGLDDEEIKDAVKSALFKAADEGGNELPPDVDGILDPRDIKEAKRRFFLLTREIFKTSFKKIARSKRNSEYTQTGGGSKKGYRLYDPGEDGKAAIDDISNQFATDMLDIFTKRNVNNETNKPEPWLTLNSHKNFGKSGLLELDDEQFVGNVISYIRSHLFQFHSNQEREMKLANSPSAPTQDVEVWGGNRDKKAALINDDINKNNTEFYKKYMSANDADRAIMDSKLNELQAKQDNRQKLSNEEREEKFRLEILQQILFMHSKHSDSLSLDPKRIVGTLQFFRSNFLGHKYRSQSFFGSMGKKTDSGEMEGGVDLGLGTDLTAKAGDSGSGRDRGQSSFPNPASAAMDTERNKIIHSKLLAALNDLRLKNPNFALALCVFWELGGRDPNTGLPRCSLGSALANVDAFSELIIAKTKDGDIATADSSCEEILFKQLRASSNVGRHKGKSIEQAHEETNAILGEERPISTFRNWLTNGIKHVCDFMKRTAHLSDEPTATGIAKKPTLASFGPTASSAQSRRFDATRLSPLSSKLKTPQVMTNPDTGEKTYQPNS
jgi:hypothetical protein